MLPSKESTMPARVFLALVCTTTLLISINIAAVWGDNHNIGTYKTTNRGGGLACLLEKDLDEAVDALMAGGEGDNYDWLQSILDSGRCIMMKKLYVNFGSASLLDETGFAAGAPPGRVVSPVSGQNGGTCAEDSEPLGSESGTPAQKSRTPSRCPGSLAGAHGRYCK